MDWIPGQSGLGSNKAKRMMENPLPNPAGMKGVWIGCDLRLQHLKWLLLYLSGHKRRK